jgi:hypothetical protein
MSWCCCSLRSGPAGQAGIGIGGMGGFACFASSYTHYSYTLQRTAEREMTDWEEEREGGRDADGEMQRRRVAKGVSCGKVT